MELHRSGACAGATPEERGRKREEGAAASKVELAAAEYSDEEEEGEEEDAWLDRMLTRAALVALVATVGAWAYLYVCSIRPLPPPLMPPRVEL